MTPISNDLRKRIVDVRRSEKLTFAELADRFKISLSAAHVIVTRYEKTGCYKARSYPGKPPKLELGFGDDLKQWIEAEPDITLDGLAERLAEKGKQAHPSTIKRLLDKLGYTYKKKRRLLQSENEKMFSNAAENGWSRNHN